MWLNTKHLKIGNISGWFFLECFSVSFNTLVFVGYSQIQPRCCREYEDAYPEYNLNRIWATIPNTVCMWKISLLKAVVSFRIMLFPDWLFWFWGSYLFVQCLAWCKQNKYGGQKIIPHLIINHFIAYTVHLHCFFVRVLLSNFNTLLMLCVSSYGDEH